MPLGGCLTRSPSNSLNNKGLQNSWCLPQALAFTWTQERLFKWRTGGEWCSNLHELGAGRQESGGNLIEKEQDAFSSPQGGVREELIPLEPCSVLLSLGYLCVRKDEHICASVNFPDKSPPCPSHLYCLSLLWKNSVPEKPLVGLLLIGPEQRRKKLRIFLSP